MPFFRCGRIKKGRRKYITPTVNSSHARVCFLAHVQRVLPMALPVDSLIKKKPCANFNEFGRKGEWDPRLLLGNPATDLSLNQYLKAVTAEQQCPIKAIDLYVAFAKGIGVDLTNGFHLFRPTSPGGRNC